VIAIPKVTLAGRPNVGKSTLFNRICGRRKAITDGRPGSTRDRNFAQTSWQGAGFELVDTGGLLLETDDPLLGPAVDQAERAIEESDLVVLIVDRRAGLLPDDEAIATRLRRGGKSVVLAVNKCEAPEDGLGEFERLGFERAHAISAEHGLGIGDLLDTVLAQLPRVELLSDEQAPVRLALVGRPNVGKSSLLNRIVGSSRAVVSDVPGTTRDAVDGFVERGGNRYAFVDTAGIRRPRLLKERVDQVAVVQARKSIERAEVAILILDAADGMRELDATVGGYIQEAGCGVVLAVNKWDLARELGLSQRSFREQVRERLKFLAFAPIVFISAHSGLGLTALLRAASAVRASSRTRVATGELNRVIAKACQVVTPRAAKGGRPVTLLFATQVGVAPPTFVLAVNRPVDLHFSHKRYLENQLRAAFGFEGTPLGLKVRTRKH
jgi:GTP-binding protein